MNKNDIKKIIIEKDTLLWEENIIRKSSLKIYNEYKNKMKQESFYTNSYASNLLFKCRTNTLTLKDRNSFQQGDTKCPCCPHTYEDLEHFLLFCEEYSSYRKEIVCLQQPYPEDTSSTIATLLLFMEKPTNKQIETMNYIKKIYNIRKKKIEINVT